MPAPNLNPPKEGQHPTIIKPYSTKELAQLYGIHTKTFTKWLYPYKKLVGVRIGRFYNVLQVKKIFMYLGPPSATLDD